MWIPLDSIKQIRGRTRSLISTTTSNMLLSDIKNVKEENKGIPDPLIVKILDRSPEWIGTIQPMLRIVIADKSDAQQAISYAHDDDLRMQVGNVFVLTNYVVFHKLIQIRKTTKLYKWVIWIYFMLDVNSTFRAFILCSLTVT